jgi:hypothetical protein
MSVNIDVMTAVTTIIGAAPRIFALREVIDQVFRDFDFATFDRLTDYAWALAHAHTQYCLTVVPKRKVTAIARELSALRKRLLTDAESLATAGLIQRERLQACNQRRGHLGLVQDMNILLTVLSEYKGGGGTLTGAQEGELRRSRAFTSELLGCVKAPQRSPTQQCETIGLRHRYFTLCVRSYELARRAVHYVRADAGDAERIAPSLYAARRARRHGKDEGEDSARYMPDAVPMQALADWAEPALRSLPSAVQGAAP